MKMIIFVCLQCVLWYLNFLSEEGLLAEPINHILLYVKNYKFGIFILSYFLYTKRTQRKSCVSVHIGTVKPTVILKANDFFNTPLLIDMIKRLKIRSLYFNNSIP